MRAFLRVSLPAGALLFGAFSVLLAAAVFGLARPAAAQTPVPDGPADVPTIEWLNQQARDHGQAGARAAAATEGMDANAAGFCEVSALLPTPGRYASVNAALADQACKDIFLFPETFSETLVITRNVFIQGFSVVAGVLETTLNANGLGASVVVTSPSPASTTPVSVTLKKLNFTGGSGAPGCEAGGIFNSARGRLTLEKVRVLNGFCPSGAGGLNNKGVLNAVFLELYGNRSIAGAGGLRNSNFADLELVDLALNRGGTALTTTLGGGILNEGAMTLNRSSVISNVAASGAGIANTGVLTVASTTIGENKAYRPSATPSDRRGAGIFSSGTTNLLFSTLANNRYTVTPGGGVFEDGAGANLYRAAGVTRVNSAVLYRAPVAGGNPGNCSGTLTDGAGTLDSDGTCGFGPARDIRLNPAPQDMRQLPNIPEYQYTLNPDSPARDIGVTSVCFASAVRETDQTGNLRPSDSDGDTNPRCDAGAQETAWYTAADSSLAYNLLANPDFADGLTRWTAAGTGVSVSHTQGAARATGAGYLTQDILAVPTKRYFVTAWLRLNSQANAPPGSGVTLQMLDGAAVLGSTGLLTSTSLTPGRWTRVSFETQSVSWTNTLVYRIIGGAQMSVDLDQVHASPLPVPAETAPSALTQRIYLPLLTSS